MRKEIVIRDGWTRGQREKEREGGWKGEVKGGGEEAEEAKSSEGTYALSKCATLCTLDATAPSLCAN